MKNGKFTTITPSGANGTTAVDINNKDEIVGTHVGTENNRHEIFT